MRAIHLVAALGCLGPMTGCITPLALPPREVPLSNHALGLDEATDAATVPDRWWQAFGDPSLSQLVDQAIAGSPSLRLASARVERARALAAGSDADRSWNIDLSASAVRQRFPEHALFPPDVAGHQRNIGSTQAGATRQLDFFGKNEALFQSALGLQRAAEADADAARIELAAQVVDRYVELAQLIDRRDITTRTLGQRTEILKLINRRLAFGLDTTVELQLGEGALFDTRTEIESIDERIRVQRHALSALVGLPAGSLSTLTPRLADLVPASLPDRLPTDLLGRRADVAAARERVEAAVHDVDAARAEFYPSIDLIGLAGFGSIGFDRLFRFDDRAWSVGPALHLPLFDSGRLRANQRVRSADLDSAIASYNALVLDVVRDAAQSIDTLQSIDAQQQQQARAQASIEQAYAASLARFRSGLDSYLTVLSAESSVLAQRRLNVDLRARRLSAQTALMQALGGGYVAVDARPLLGMK